MKTLTSLLFSRALRQSAGAAVGTGAGAGAGRFSCNSSPEAIEFCAGTRKACAAAALRSAPPSFFWTQSQPLVMSLSRRIE